MINRLFKRYLWLVETISNAGESGITLAEIQGKWMRSSINDDGQELIDRTFHNHKNAILQQFDIEIKCNKLNCYYIDREDLYHNKIIGWLKDSIAVEELLLDSKSIKSKILLEPVPGGLEYLPVIAKTLKDKTRLLLDYQSFHKEKQRDSEMLIEPLCLKLFKRRWYLLANNMAKNGKRIYALDRMLKLEMTDEHFYYPSDFSGEDFFSNYFGIATDGIYSGPTTVRLKAYREFSSYLESLPLHHSQKLIENGDGYAVFEYFLIPTFDFVQEILSHGDYLEVLDPDDLRQHIIEKLNSALNLYR